MHRIAAVLKLLTQLNKYSSNNFIRHECQNGILGGCFFTNKGVNNMKKTISSITKS